MIWAIRFAKFTFVTYSPYLSRVKLDDIGELHLSKNSDGEVYTSFSGKEVYFEHFWSGILESNGFSPLMKLDNAVPVQWDYHAVERVDDELVLILRDRLDNISGFSDIQKFVTFKLLKYDLNGNYVGAGYNASNVNVNGVTLETWGLPNSINSKTAKDQLDLLLRESKVIAYSELEKWVISNRSLWDEYLMTGRSVEGWYPAEGRPNKNGRLEEWAFYKYQELFPDRSMLQGFGVDGARSEESDSITYLRSDSVITSTWSDTVRINLEKTGSSSDSVIQAKQVDKSEYDSGFVGSIVTGTSGDDIIRGLAGFDQLFGKAGDDLIHGGNGRDIIDGGSGSDELHGDFGWNTFWDQQDGSKDLIAIKSDQHLSNFWYGKAGNSPNGEKADFIEGLDAIDEIKIIGVFTPDISVVDNVTARGVTGIGIYAKGTLEAVYTGGNLSTSQIQNMTTGDGSTAAMNNQMWSYWGDNTVPPLQT